MLAVCETIYYLLSTLTAESALYVQTEITVEKLGEQLTGLMDAFADSLINLKSTGLACSYSDHLNTYITRIWYHLTKSELISVQTPLTSVFYVNICVVL